MSAELVGSAHKIVHISPRVVLDDAIPIDVQFLDRPRRREVVTIAPIVPNNTSQRILNFTTGWNQPTTEEVKTGARALFIYGVIEYHDDYSRHWWWFAANRQTGFCFGYRPTGGVREPVFETCEESAYTYTR